jgi:CheY-like chemotaxis protein
MKLTDFVILLGEDGADQVALLRRAMARANLVNPLKVVGDGEEAIRYLSGCEEYADRRRHSLPSLVLFDLRLPRKSGLGVLEWMRRQPALRHVPVIVLTASPLSEDRERALALGAHSYLEKPVELNGLFEIVRSLGVYWMILHPAMAVSGAGARPSEAPAVPVR